MRGNFKLIITCALVLAACTKKRETKWPQGEEDAIFEKSYVNSAKVSLQTGDVATLDRGSSEMHAVSEVVSAPVTDVKGEERLKPLFEKLNVQAPKNSGQLVRFEVGRKYVTAYKVLLDSGLDVSLLESQIAKKHNEELWVPLFQVPIQAFGVVEKVKNELNEETNTLRLKETEPERATHVKFSTLPTARLPVGIPPDDSIEPKQIFVRSRVDDNLLSRDEIEKALNVRLSQDGLYYVRHVGEKLLFFNLRKLGALEKDLADEVKRRDRGGDKREDIFRCSSEVVELVTAEFKEDCVLQLAYDLEAKIVVAKRRAEDTSGTLGPVVVFEPTSPSDDADALIKIVYRSKPRENHIDFLDRGSLLAVDDMKSSEFFMRRTLQDSPNGFSYTFAGTSGRLELVKFVFERNQVRVLRVDPLLAGEGSSNTDQETLMSFPADYVKLVNTDESGSPLASPRAIPARHDERAALARIDWTRNTIPEVSSPLEYYQIGVCFDGATERIVADVDVRLNPQQGGLLNFSLVSTYAASRGVDCVGVFSEDYFDNVQKNYTFKERISFQRHTKPVQAEEPWLSLPFEAQKRLGFGLFTYSKKKADSSGRVDVDGAKIPLPAVFDLRTGQKIKYVLAGLPHESDERSQQIRNTIIRQTARVIKDINLAFRRAFDGTPMQNREDVLELVVEDAPNSQGHLGDLDKNFIYYISKATESGVIGLGGAHHNPRSGEVASASVYLYGGNMLAMVQDLREMAQARKLYRQRHGGEAVNEGTDAVLGRAVSGTAPAVAMPSNVARLQKAALLAKGMKAQRSLKDFSSRLKNFQSAPLFSNEELRRGGVNANAQALKFRQKVNQAIDEKAFGREEKLTRIFSGRKLPSVLERMRDNNVCVFQTSALDMLQAADESFLEEHDNIELLGEAWASTLAHELGHNLGLRHNFEGSFDQGNWKFAADESSERNYSSVMDYISDDLIRYDGFGPQDVSALRAAYAGLLEVAPEAQRIETDGQVSVAGPAKSLPLVGDRFVKIADLLPALGASSWINISDAEIKALPLKKFKFCSDEDAGLRPTCNRFDMGTSPSEIVQSAIQSYKELYSLRNFAGNKLNFSIYGTDYYIGRLFAKFIPIRQNLEETFFQLIETGNQEDYGPYLQATIDGMLFFNEVVRSPDASTLAREDERFVRTRFAVQDPETGEVIGSEEAVVERKALRDLRLDSESERLKVMGVEWDKAISLILLTERSMGFSRYENISLRVAYPDIEKFLVENPEDPMTLPTVSLLADVLADNVQAVVTTLDGKRRSLPAQFKAEMTELTRFMALDGATFRLDVDGMEASDNNSAFFRVLSAFRSPRNKTFITKPGSVNDLKYWALGKAGVAEVLVNQGAMLSTVNKAKADIQTDLAAWFVEQDAANAERLAVKIDASLAKLPESVGPRTAAELRPYMDLLAGTAAQLQELSGNPEVEKRLVNLMTEEQRDRFDSFAKNAPSVGMAMASLSGEQLGLGLIEDLKPAGTLDSFEGTTFRNVETLSSFFLMAHPNYRQ